MIDILCFCIALYRPWYDVDRLMGQYQYPLKMQNPQRMKLMVRGSKGRNKYGCRRALLNRNAVARDEGDKGGNT